MDTFKISSLEKEEKNVGIPTIEDIKEPKKMYECAQIECMPRHLGMAIAYKNYWIYMYDIVSK